MIEGHAEPACNAVFRHEVDMTAPRDWPVLKNAQGVFCFRDDAKDQWVLGHTHQTDAPCLASIQALDGPIPVGRQAWLCQGQDCTLTVTLMVCIIRHVHSGV